MTQQGPLVMGIDLGTACSCVGVWRNGVVEIVPNDQGNRTTPSCVAFNDQERLIGEGAKNQVARNASNTVFDVKRLMGRSFSDASVQSDAKYWPFGVSEGPHPYDKPLIMVRYLGEEKGFSPEEISAMLLAKMKETAEAYVGVPITDAVITVPAYFNGSQRQATKDAGYIAGLNVMRIINEPTAAAIAYSVSGKMRESSTVLVYDLGGGTLDVSLFQVEQGVLRVIATAGDTHLGGEDFTNNMVDHFVNDFMSKNQVDMSGDKKALGRLRRSCEEAKKKLSTNPRIPVEVDALFQGIDFHSDITRDEFEELNVDVFRRCEEAIARCLMDANMGRNKVDDVVLVGGSTRIPRVQQLVREFFGGKEPCRSINADEAVAYGATFQAGMLIIRRGENHPCRQLPAVIDITPFSQGIRMVEGLMCVVVPRNAGIPTEITTMEFTTTEDNQSSFDITVYEGDGDITAAGGGALAKKFHLPCVLASAPKGVPKIKVVFFMNPHGIMEVWAQDEAGNKTMMNEVGRFSTEEIQRMEEDAHTYKALDEEHSKNVQARNDIENMLYTMRNAIKQLRDSAERLLLPPPPPPPPEASSGEKEKEPTTKKPLLQTPSSKWRLVNLNKLMKGRNSDVKDTVRKLQEGIKILQETADGTADWLKNNELTTTEIIAQKKHIEDVYQRNVQ